MDEEACGLAAHGAERPEGQGERGACEGRDALAPTASEEATVGPAEAVLEPGLLDLYAECDVGLSERSREWVEGRVHRASASVAREAELCLGAAEDAWAGALADVLDDQLEALGAREGVSHRLALAMPCSAPNALQCAGRILGPCYDAPRGQRVLWRARIDLASTPERVRIEIRSRETDAEPVGVDVDTSSVALLIEGERTAFAHGGDAERLRTLGETVAARLRALVTENRRRGETR